VPGPQGPKGGGADYFEFMQSVPSTKWVVAHGLGRYPSVTVTDSSGDTGIGGVQYVDANNLILSFGAPFAGSAYLI
jgi:hypothetical protein